MQEFVADQSSGGQAEGGENTAQAQPQITSLDSLSEFEFQGQKLTPDQLQEVFQGYKTLSEKQKAIASEDRFWSNLDTDLESVVQDPQLADKFKSIYPEKFHRILDRALKQAHPQLQNTQSQLPKEVLSKLSKVDSLEAMIHSQAVEAANAKLDAMLPKLYEKYPLANNDQVLAKAEAMLSQGYKLNDAAWERLVKESHEGVDKVASGYYKKQLQAQVEKGQAGRDAGPGGAVPGKAPARPRTFAEAEAAVRAHLKGQGLS